MSDRRSPAILLVTHHVEEIPVGFTHVLLLRGGEVVAAGPLAEELTAENLSRIYAMDVELGELGGRYSARRAGAYLNCSRKTRVSAGGTPVLVRSC